MSNSWTSDKLRETLGPRTLCAWVSLGLCVLPALTGCTTTTPQTHSGDPLFGEYYPKGPNGQPMPPPPAPTKTSAVVLPYPSTNTGSTTAALASNSGLPGGRPLAINESNGASWALTNNTATNSGVPTGADRATGSARHHRRPDSQRPGHAASGPGQQRRADQGGRPHDPGK